MKKLIGFCLFITGFAYSNISFSQTIVYVNHTATGTNDGSSWQNAFINLDTALRAANNATGLFEIRVAQGIYKPSVKLLPSDPQDTRTFVIDRGGIKLFGGYNAATGSRNHRLYPTILNGEGDGDINTVNDRASRILLLAFTSTPADSVMIDGFEMSNAYAPFFIVPYKGLNIHSYGCGLAMVNAGSNVVISNCRITRNYHDRRGAGLFMNNSSPVLINCKIDRNFSPDDGGHVIGSGGGGGAYINTNSHPVFINSIFTNNGISTMIEQNEGGAYSIGINSSAKFYNCSFVENYNTNHSQNISEGYVRPGSTVNYYNCISNGRVFNMWNPADPPATNRFADNSILVLGSTDFTGTNNIFDPPAYTWIRDEADIPQCGVAFNAGDASLIPSLYNTAFDFLGVQRIMYDTIDIGAIEVREQTSTDASALQMTDTAVTGYVVKNSNTLYGVGCDKIFAQVSGNTNDNSIEGLTTSRIWIEPTQPANFVRRHFEITAQQNAATSTGRIKLYFSQADFDAFNAVNAIKLPVNSTDAAGKANLVIDKIGGSSSNNTGLPSTYPGSLETINPVDNDIVWNDTRNWWEVSFNITGFSGFFVRTQHTVLPLQFISFEAVRNNKINKLIWKTAAEINVVDYEIQRSINGRDFITIANVNALNGISQTYLYDDTLNFTGTVFYRIKANEINGKTDLSKIASLSVSASGEINIYPNPAADFITINTNNLMNTYVTVMDTKGSLLKTEKIISSHQQIDITKLIKGIYFIRFADGSIQKLIKQ